MTTPVLDPRWTISIVEETDLVDLLPLLHSYCQFYHQTEGIPITSDERLLAVSRALIADPTHEGLQLLVRRVDDRTPLGFATIYWNWSTLKGGRLAIMEDLYVKQEFRGQGIADQLIGECARHARGHRALCLTWQTSVNNARAQSVYARCGGVKSDRWLNYSLEL